MRRGAGERFERGLRHLQGLVLWIRHAVLLYETGGGFNRYAHSAGPTPPQPAKRVNFWSKNAIFDDFENLQKTAFFDGFGPWD